MNPKDLIPYDKNARIHNVDAIADSIRDFGFKEIVLVDENNVIINGHGRVKASIKLGLEKIPVSICTDLSEEEKKAFRLLDNKVAELTEWDEEKLKSELQSIEDIDMSAFGNSIEELEKQQNEEKAVNKLAESFIVTPFDILDARSGVWLERKRYWKSLIQDNGQARQKAKAYSNKAMNQYKGNGAMPNETSILDPVLSEVVLHWFSPSLTNQNVFDCFAGDTVFGYVSSYLGSNFTGIELRKEQADFNNGRISKFKQSKYICDDGRNVKKHLQENSQDLLFSCPPYFDLEVYSDNPNDASNQKEYSDFLSILRTAFHNAIDCLKENRFAVIVVGDVRNKKTGFYYNFPNDIINIFQEKNVSLYNNIKLLTPIGNAQLRVSRYMTYRKTAHVYQDVLVFFKGNPKTIKDIFPIIKTKKVEIDDASEDI